MNAPVPTGVEGFLARFDTLRSRLPGDPAPRLAAAETLRIYGFPDRRNEAWHFTNLRPLEQASFVEPVPSLITASVLARLPELGTRLVLVDGRYRPELSSPPTDCRFEPFSRHGAFGALAQPSREPLVALNTMLSEDGVTLTAPCSTDAGTITLISLATSTAHATAFHPHHTIRLEPGARLVLLEVCTGDGTYLHNPVTEVELGDHATLTHIRLQDEAATAFNLATIYAAVGTGATYDGFTLALGGRLTRAELHVNLTGRDAVAHLNAAQLLSDSQHADFTTVVRHLAPSCTSRQTVKNVLTDRARGVFQGRIEVARAAQKTDGYQMNQALLLSPEAEVNSKPELEIFADDVKCSHGATVGELDAEQLFYLRSRGIAAVEARAILVRAFLAEAIDTVRHDGAREVLEQAVSSWWERQAA
jgi:Fe-S cluster assembly protein SufD